MKLKGYEIIGHKVGVVGKEFAIIASEIRFQVFIRDRYLMKSSPPWCTDFDKKKVAEAWKQAIAEVSTKETEMLEAYVKLNTKEKLAYVAAYPSFVWGEMEQSKNGTYSKSVINKEIAKLKLDYEFEEETTEYKLKQIVIAQAQSAQLKKDITATHLALEQHTVETIKSLDMKQIKELLEQKWIDPIIFAIGTIPNEIILRLADAVATLQEKYAVTYKDIESEINASQRTLSELVSQLTGDEFAIKGLIDIVN